MKIILGIDPGSIRTGYGILKIKANKYERVASGIIDLSKEKVFSTKLLTLSQRFKELCQEFLVEEISLETLIHVRNVSSLTKLAQARGAIIAGCMQGGSKKAFEYSPNLIKKSISGYGHAEKEDLANVVMRLLNMRSKSSFDETDALAIGLTHALYDTSSIGKNLLAEI